MSKKYFIQRDGKTFGPYDDKQLMEAAKNNKLSRSDKLSTQKEGPWRSVDSVSALSNLLPSPEGSSQWFDFELGANEATQQGQTNISNPYWKNMDSTAVGGRHTKNVAKPMRVSKAEGREDSSGGTSGIRYIILSIELLFLLAVAVGVVFVFVVPTVKEAIRQSQRSPYQDAWDNFERLYKTQDYRKALDVVREIMEVDTLAKGPEGKTAEEWERICFVKNAERFNRNVDGWINSGGSLEDLDRRLKQKSP